MVPRGATCAYKMSQMDVNDHLKAILATTLKINVPFKLIPIIMAREFNRGGFHKYLVSLSKTLVFNCIIFILFLSPYFLVLGAGLFSHLRKEKSSPLSIFSVTTVSWTIASFFEDKDALKGSSSLFFIFL
jgi:hypothetical protein